MKIEDAEKYFGHQGQMARAMGLRSQSAITNWKREGRTLVPEIYARRLAEKTRGKRRNGIVLKFVSRVYERARAG